MSSQIRVKSNKAKKLSSQIRVKSNIFDLTPIFDLRNAPSNNLPTPTALKYMSSNQPKPDLRLKID